MPEILKPVEERGTRIGYAFWCPGCEQHHLYYVPRWSFNGDMEKPTFVPSLLNTWEHGPAREPRRCHLFVTGGKIIYCGDCTHPLAGRTVDMPPHQF